jgi:hypothetical protein
VSLPRFAMRALLTYPVSTPCSIIDTLSNPPRCPRIDQNTPPLPILWVWRLRTSNRLLCKIH